MKLGRLHIGIRKSSRTQFKWFYCPLISYKKGDELDRFSPWHTLSHFWWVGWHFYIAIERRKQK